MPTRYITEDALRAALRADARRYGCLGVEEMDAAQLYRVLAQCSAREEAASEVTREARKEWPRIVRNAFDPTAPEHQAARAALAFRGNFRTWADVKTALTAPMMPPQQQTTEADVWAETLLSDVSWGVLEAAAVIHAERDRTAQAPEPSYRRGVEHRKGGDTRHRRIDVYFNALQAKDARGPSYFQIGRELGQMGDGEKSAKWAHACCRQYAFVKALRREPVPAALLLYHDAEIGAVIPPLDVVDRWAALVRAMCWRIDTVGPEAAHAYAAGELDLVAILAAHEMQLALPEKHRRIVELMRTLSDAREYGGHGMDESWFLATLALACEAVA